MSRVIAICMLSALALAVGCGKERPDDPDGSGTIVVSAFDTSGFFQGSVGGEPFPMDSAEVSVTGQTTVFTATGVTNERGEISFDGLATGRYSVFVRRQVMVGPNKKVFTGFGDVKVGGLDRAHENVLVKTVSVSNLMISEIFYAGSCAASFYFYDQFVELYNAAAETLYLDNIIVTRQAQVKDPEMETKDYVSAIYAFQLKGTGKQWPIAPGQYVVIAADAVNHKLYGCALSADLSHADYETFNALGHDYDVPGVPNFDNIMPGKTIDFLINVSHNGVVIAEGGDYPIDEDNRMRIPIEKVIDAVEYASNPTATTKEMTVRVDAGFAGIGITKWGGQSTERREPGLDTNNSTFDFVVIPRPTPGYFYGEQNRMRVR
ncbi:MAG: DUF4876 domain-containing protein [Candidatus Krumholzibacteriia bacterium]